MAATGGAYREAVVEHDGRLVGRFPYVEERIKWGRIIYGMPQLTYVLGPATCEGSGALCNVLSKRHSITRSLLQQIPDKHSFYQIFHQNCPDSIVFQEEGYESFVRFTYEVHPAPREILWKNLKDKTRNVIRRAQERFDVSDRLCSDEFMNEYIRNAENNGLSNLYSRDIFGSISDEALRRDQGRLLCARERSGMLAASIFYVWDKGSAYYLMTTRSSDAGNGAVSLLIWSSLLDAAERGLVYDFGGIGTHGSRMFFNGFGGQPKPRYGVKRFSTWHRAVMGCGRLTNPSKYQKFL